MKNNKNYTEKEILNIKSLNTEEKIQYFKDFFTSESIADTLIISNMFFIIDGIASIDEDCKDNEKIFFNSIEEYVDIKLALKGEIDQFCIKLLEYYLGVLQGIDIKLDELKEHIPNTYFNIMFILNPVIISKLMNKYINRIDLNNVKPAFNALDIYNSINNLESIELSLMQSIIESVNKNV